MLWGSLILCKTDEREEGVPGQGLSRKSGEPEAGCGMLIRFHGLKVPRDYKFLSCKKTIRPAAAFCYQDGQHTR